MCFFTDKDLKECYRKRNALYSRLMEVYRSLSLSPYPYSLDIKKNSLYPLGRKYLIRFDFEDYVLSERQNRTWRLYYRDKDLRNDCGYYDSEEEAYDAFYNIVRDSAYNRYYYIHKIKGRYSAYVQSVRMKEIDALIDDYVAGKIDTDYFVDRFLAFYKSEKYDDSLCLGDMSELIGLKEKIKEYKASEISSDELKYAAGKKRYGERAIVEFYYILNEFEKQEVPLYHFVREVTKVINDSSEFDKLPAATRNILLDIADYSFNCTTHGGQTEDGQTIHSWRDLREYVRPLVVKLKRSMFDYD